ncbi:MAG: hypothetical protein HW400_900, partial [Candidatus Levybacteria bacterium]|nr:hypothetical protein [Candidatus Levybacteria bacterium]
PARQFAQANNTKRRSDVNAILNAVNQYMADNKGLLPGGIPIDPDPALDISDTGADICAAIVPTYIAALPADPQVNNGTAISEADCGGTYTTGYSIVRNIPNNRITITATTIELNDQVSVTR